MNKKEMKASIVKSNFFTNQASNDFEKIMRYMEENYGLMDDGESDGLYEAFEDLGITIRVANSSLLSVLRD